jgi:Flp pilus assembly protein TadG
MTIGLAVDVGHAFLVRRQLASVADDAALSGSQAIDLPELHGGHLQLNPGQARSDAMSAISANPATSGSASATSETVTVTVSRRVPTILLGIVGIRSLKVSAHATAGPRAP